MYGKILYAGRVVGGTATIIFGIWIGLNIYYKCVPTSIQGVISFPFRASIEGCNYFIEKLG